MALRLGAGVPAKGDVLVDHSFADKNDAASDMRSAPRVALLLRPAKIVSSKGEFVCILRDVSERGVRLRLFHALGDGDRFAIEVATGERLAMEPVWQQGAEAGFSFSVSIDVERFLADVCPFPRRPLRLSIAHPARITVGGALADARLLNISRQGAKIETDFHLSIGQPLRIDASEFPDCEATVLWRDQRTYGVVFRRIMSLEELALRAFRIQV